MPIRATDVAAEFLRMSSAARRAMGAYEIVALTIIANGWNLANKGEPLIGELVTCGNLMPEIRAIDACLTRNHGRVTAVEATRAIGSVDGALLAGVYGVYGRMGEDKLRSLVTRPDSPWALTRSSDGIGAPISNDSIMRHYAQIRRERDAMLGFA